MEKENKIENENALNMNVKDFANHMSMRLGWDNGCRNCIHKDVCSIMSNEGEKSKSACTHFRKKTTDRYGDVYELFEPVFEWIETNHPQDEVFFIVHRNQARMYLQHGPVVSSKSLMGLKCPNPAENKDKNREEKENKNG